MGFGDDLITTALARRAFQKIGRKLRPGTGSQVEWSEVFDGCPYLDKESGPWLKCYPGCRPYIDYARSDSDHFAWNYDFRVEPGTLTLTGPEMLAWTQRDFVLIEPDTKRLLGNDNKNWGLERWQSVVDAMPDVRFLQASGRGIKARWLRGVERVRTETFRDACALLSHARAFVGTDGGLHHAAAALGVPAVVVWGGFAPPAVLGYAGHINLCKARHWCGSLSNCLHCQQSLEWISVSEVTQALESCLRSDKTTDDLRFRGVDHQREDDGGDGSRFLLRRADSGQEVFCGHSESTA